MLDRKPVADIFKELLERRSFVDQAPVQPRHSWNTNKRISSWTMFNLTRHSHRHAQGEVPYQDRKPFPDAPMIINGYLTTLIVALIPPLWHRLMTPGCWLGIVTTPPPKSARWLRTPTPRAAFPCCSEHTAPPAHLRPGWHRMPYKVISPTRGAGFLAAP